MISFSCKKCSKSFKVPDSKGGKDAKCPGCGHLLHIPMPGGAAPQPLALRATTSESMETSDRRHRYHAIDADTKIRARLAGRQRANMILLGVILLIGFLMPVYLRGEPTFSFINISILGVAEAPIWVKILALIPGVAAIGLFILQATTKHPIRGSVMIFMACMPFFILLSQTQNINNIALVQFIPIKAAFTLFLVFLGLIAAPLALLIGMRSRSYKPRSDAAYWVGIGGAVSWFFFLVAPVLPSEQGTMFMMIPIKLINTPESGVLPLGLLLAMVCMSISAVLCVLSRPTFPEAKVRNQNNTAYLTLVIGFVVFILSISTVIVTSFPAFVAMIKILCVVMGVFLLFSAGVTDLLVGHIYHRHHQALENEYEDKDEYADPESPLSYNAPPDIPTRPM